MESSENSEHDVGIGYAPVNRNAKGKDIGKSSSFTNPNSIYNISEAEVYAIKQLINYLIKIINKEAFSSEVLSTHYGRLTMIYDRLKGE